MRTTTDTLMLPLDALIAMARGGERVSALDGISSLLLPLDETPAPADHPVLERWLRSTGCPVIGIGSAAAPLAAACDTVVSDQEEAQPLLARISAAPLAASVFVQLLRATEGMALAPALFAESLAYSTLQAGPEYRRWLETRRASRLEPVLDEGPAVLLRRDGDTLRLTLNRASLRNAMSVEMRDALITALRQVDADTRQLHIDALGKCFSTGGDLGEFGSAPDPATAHLVRSLALPGRELAARAARAEVRVHGACIGSGIEFPAFAGRINASANAWFQLPELEFGLIPGAGGCVSIPRRIGRQRTAWMVLSARRIDAPTALAWGLVDAVS